ncbi:MAG: transposase [Gammaproteobacteria bacterium]|nr:transposase [Gammaproteobacteria bacterium]MBI5616362.1 transposase [Gammaproteobacteria bacterium]
MWYDGLCPLPWWGVALVALGFTHLTCVAVTVYLHRHQAHRALALHPLLAHAFRAWLWLTTGMRTREWIAVHRRHHARVETPEDPHSPWAFGIRRVLFEGAELYQAAARDPELVARYGQGAPDDFLECSVYRHDRTGVGLMLVADVVLFGPEGLALWAVQMIWIPVFAAGIINGLAHWRGYRNFDTADASTNLTPWGILIAGEELHNNHHAYAGSARFSAKPWEFDIGWAYIRLFALCRLARIRKLAPCLCIAAPKPALDGETLRALVRGRLHVMSDYAERVVRRVHREETRKADAATRRDLKAVRRVLLRADRRVDEGARERLAAVLGDCAPLAVVHHFQERLRGIFAERAATQERLLALFQEWCRQAEQTGVAALADFARRLRGYSLTGP